MGIRFIQVVVQLLGLLVLVLYIALLASPFAIAVIFPAAKDAITPLGTTLIPGLIALGVAVVYKNEVSGILGGLAGLLRSRIDVSAGGATISIQAQQAVGPVASPVDVEKIQQLASATSVLWNYYYGFIRLAILGSQFKLLIEMATSAKGSKTEAQVRTSYEEFIAKVPLAQRVLWTFQGWIRFLHDHQLVGLDPKSKGYVITDTGRRFVTVALEQGLNPAHMNL